MYSHCVLHSVVEYRAEREIPPSPLCGASATHASFPRGNHRQHWMSMLPIAIQGGGGVRVRVCVCMCVLIK